MDETYSIVDWTRIDPVAPIVSDLLASSGMYFGYFMSSVGDANGDGTDDLWVHMQYSIGYMVMLHLRPNGSVLESRSVGISDFYNDLYSPALPTMTGYSHLGRAAVPIGDINSDNRTDYAISFPYRFDGGAGSVTKPQEVVLFEFQPRPSPSPTPSATPSPSPSPSISPTPSVSASPSPSSSPGWYISPRGPQGMHYNDTIELLTAAYTAGGYQTQKSYLSAEVGNGIAYLGKDAKGLHVIAVGDPDGAGYDYDRH